MELSLPIDRPEQILTACRMMAMIKSQMSLRTRIKGFYLNSSLP